MEIAAAVLHAPGRPLSVEPVTLDEPRAGEVLVRVAAAGVCHTDLHLADGKLGDGRWPMVLGGATGAVSAADEDVVAAVLRLVAGGVDHAFEAVGLPATIRQAWDVLRPGGTAIVVGIAPKGVEVAVPRSSSSRRQR